LANFRRGHSAARGSGLRLGAVGAILIVVIALVLIRRTLPVSDSVPLNLGHNDDTVEYLPSSERGEVVHHQNFTLSYLEEYEQAQWVAYELTRSELNMPRVPRTDHFNADYDVSTRSAFYRDYSGSGYTRGHLAPAADMAFDTLAMRESFYMSNVCPQVRAFNNGIWRELEEQTRDWARKFGRLYIITGPVLTSHINTRIGQNRVAVPELFYKVILNPDAPDLSHIAFLIPNDISTKPLADYVVSFDSVETLTSLDFFPLFDDKLDGNSADVSGWPMNEMRYKIRVREWNNQ